jgi:hypothetical protein
VGEGWFLFIFQIIYHMAAATKTQILQHQMNSVRTQLRHWVQEVIAQHETTNTRIDAESAGCFGYFHLYINCFVVAENVTVEDIAQLLGA